MTLHRAALAAALVLSAPVAAAQQTPDHRTIEGIMTELYASVTREHGKPFAWERLRAIMFPGAVMLPQPRPNQGANRVMSVDEFIAMVDASWKPVIGTDRDRGFYERQTNLVVDQYGDIAQAFTTYEKGPYEPRGVQSRGINTVQLVRREGRWWILSITWDEENTAGPLPPKYRGQ